MSGVDDNDEEDETIDEAEEVDGDWASVPKGVDEEKGTTERIGTSCELISSGIIVDTGAAALSAKTEIPLVLVASKSSDVSVVQLMSRKVRAGQEKSEKEVKVLEVSSKLKETERQ